MIYSLHVTGIRLVHREMKFISGESKADNVLHVGLEEGNCNAEMEGNGKHTYEYQNERRHQQRTVDKSVHWNYWFNIDCDYAWACKITRHINTNENCHT